MALVHPERIDALIVQDAVAHNEGLGANWKPATRFLGRSRGQRKRAAHKICCRCRRRGRAMWENDRMSNGMTRISGRIEFAFLSQSGQGDIQSDLFYDYRANVRRIS